MCSNEARGCGVYLVHILVHVGGHVEVDHQLDVDQVQSSAQHSSADHHLKLTLQETLQITQVNGSLHN